MSLTILVLDDEKPARDGLKVILSKHNYEVKDAADLESGRAILEQGTVDVVLLDEMLPDGLGTSLLEESFPNRPLMIVITGHGAIEMAVRAMKNGAHDFLQKPVDMKQLEKARERAGEIIAMRRELQHLRDHQYGDFVLGSSHAMKEVMQQAERGAQVGASILIQGETGVGKEVVAKYIHESGPRRGAGHAG